MSTSITQEKNFSSPVKGETSLLMGLFAVGLLLTVFICSLIIGYWYGSTSVETTPPAPKPSTESHEYSKKVLA